jgi:hypothetical protein
MPAPSLVSKTCCLQQEEFSSGSLNKFIQVRLGGHFDRNGKEMHGDYQSQVPPKLLTWSVFASGWQKSEDPHCPFVGKIPVHGRSGVAERYEPLSVISANSVRALRIGGTTCH